MKLFLSIAIKDGDLSLVQHSLEHVCTSVMKHVVVKTPEEADLIVVGNPRDALRYLKDCEGTQILIATMSAHDDNGAQSLAEEYPDAIVHRPMAAEMGKNAISYLMERGRGPEL